MKQIIAVLLASFFLFTSCSNNSKNSDASPVKQQDELPVLKSDIKYEIVRTDDRNPIINLDVYIQDVSKVDDLNNQLCNQYNNGKDKFLMIMYFDDKEIAKVFHNKSTNPAISDSEFDKLDKHRIATYNFNPSTHFDRFDKNSGYVDSH